MAKVRDKTELKIKVRVIDAYKAGRTFDSLTKKIQKTIQKYEKLLKLQGSVKKV